MSRFPSVLLLLWVFPATAQGALLRVDITYTDGQILSGPLTPDLAVLPESVFASFTLSGATPGIYDLADVVESSLVFGDGTWSAGDLESFGVSLLPTDARTMAVVALTYAYRPTDTPTTRDKLAANFPLEIQGTDLASGQEFHYRYETSSQTVTIIPEPSSAVLAVLGLALILPAAHRRMRRGDCRCA